MEFSGQIFEKFKYQISSKSVQWDSNFFYAEWQEEMTKLIVVFLHFCNLDKKS